jgi:NADPH-dependent 2,4-dienoyl-CoA reductase/sulfur reductase-like enzyme
VLSFHSTCFFQVTSVVEYHRPNASEMNLPYANLVPAADTISIEHAAVIIVGAGPVGLLTALKLAKGGIDVLLLEAEKQVLQSPRATT